jgi:hypothetical protein
MAQEENRKKTLETLNEDDRDGTPRGPEFPTAGDLVLRDEKGDYFWITKAEYEACKIPRDTPEFEEMTDQMKHLTQQGVVLADVPRGGLTGTGVACILINLAGIRRPGPATKSPVHPRPDKKP